MRPEEPDGWCGPAPGDCPGCQGTLQVLEHSGYHLLNDCICYNLGYGIFRRNFVTCAEPGYFRCSIRCKACLFTWLDRFDCERHNRRLALVVALNELLARSPDAPGHRQVKLCCDAFE